MKDNFYSILRQSNRKIVIHHCHLIDDIISLLSLNDLVFFDDCLYSLYIFIKNNIEKIKKLHINCVLGFSTSLYRNEKNNGIYNINSAILHNRIHNNDITALDGFMTLYEINDLLLYDNVYLACHGNMHLELLKITNSNFKYVKLFTDDLTCAVQKLNDLHLNTDIFVYPYAFNFFISDKIVQKFGFKHIFAGKNSKRIEIERLKNDKEICEKTCHN